MKHTLSILIIALFAAFLSGCRSEDPLRHFVVADSPRMFNVVTPVSGRGVSSVIDGVRYDIAFDDVKRVATITISNLRCTEDDNGINVIFSDIEFTYEPGSHQKQRIIEQKQINSMTNPGIAVTLSDVTFVYTESNALNPARSSGFYAEFTVNDSYHVLAYPYEIFADGTTTIHNPGSDKGDFIDYDPVYTVKLYPDDMRADMTINGLTIDGEEHDMEITGLSLRLLSDGYSLAATSATRLSGSSLSGAALSDFHAKALLRDELNIDFRLEMDGRVFIVEGFLTPDMCKKTH